MTQTREPCVGDSFSVDVVLSFFFALVVHFVGGVPLDFVLPFSWPPNSKQDNNGIRLISMHHDLVEAGVVCLVGELYRPFESAGACAPTSAAAAVANDSCLN